MAPDAAPVFGRVEDPVDEWDDVEPLPFTVVGYDAETREEVEFPFLALGRLSLGAEIDFAATVGANGKVDNQRIVAYLTKNIIPEDRGRFEATLSDDRYLFDARMLVEMADWLVALRRSQSPRPTTPPSGSSRGRTRRDLTSVPGAAGKGSGTRTGSSRSR